MKKIKNLCVYCGHSNGFSDQYIKLAEEVGKLISDREINLIYGGGSEGLMGAVANSVIDNGGTIKGITTKVLDEREKPIKGTYIEIKKNINDRKKRMYELSDAFCVLPGGMGTMDEFSEILTMSEIGVNSKPLFLFNYKGFYEPFLNLFDEMIEKGFEKISNRRLLTIISSIDELEKLLK